LLVQAVLYSTVPGSRPTSAPTWKEKAKKEHVTLLTVKSLKTPVCNLYFIFELLDIRAFLPIAGHMTHLI